MAIDFIGNTIPNVAGRSLAILAQVTARPQFEVIFAAAQETALKRFNEELKDFQTKDFGNSKTVLLRAKEIRLEGKLDQAKVFQTFTTTNRLLVKNILDELDALKILADPSTSAEFETSKTKILETIDKLLAANISGLGAPDGIRDLRTQAVATIQGLSAADAASAAAAQTAIDTLSLDFSGKLAIVELNQQAANILIKSFDRILDELDLKIDDIEIEERRVGIDRITSLEKELARVFSILSLSFEGSLNLTAFVAENTVLKKELDPGSILNLFA